MKPQLFQPTDEAEARLLLLIEAFSRGSRALEGRTKLAKLDFFLRYPAYLRRALDIRAPRTAFEMEDEAAPIEARMVRYRYGPWDPAYYAVLGRLIGKGLITPVPAGRGIGFRATDAGRIAARKLADEPAWESVTERIALLRRHLNLQGSTLKKFIYEHFPEITEASWGESV